MLNLQVLKSELVNLTTCMILPKIIIMTAACLCPELSLNAFNPCPAEPGSTLPLQTV